LIAISRAARATAPSASEITSRWRASSNDACPLGSVADAARAAIAPGKTLIRKSQCHENVSVIQPPTTGPTVGARTASTPAIMVASVWSRIGKSRKTAEKTSGISVPPENPCKTRKIMRDEKFVLAAQAIDASVNTDTATTKSHRIVSKRVRNPVSGIEIISAIRYAV
jgi:hypothetical protein